MDKQTWNKFILENNGSFLQSFEWGEFQEKFGRKVFRFSSFSHPEPPAGGEGSQWQAQFIEMIVPIIKKKYWYCPKGPVMSRAIKGQEFQEKIQDITEEIKRISGNGIIFFRLGPEWQIGQGIEGKLKKFGFKQIHYDIEPSQTLTLDITKPEEDLLAQMHEKWRYNIRLAERKNVKIKMIGAADECFDKYFEEFYRLVSEGTSARHQIKHHPKEYYRQQLEIGKNPSQPSPVSSTGQALKGGSNSPPLGGVRGDFKNVLFIAEYEGKVIAANIVVIFGKTATYLHGATSNEYREVMAPHLLQWEQIKYAKAQGCAEYDFWGIVNEHTLDKRGPSWEGFTRFKKGFGGQEKNYIGYWDYPMDKKWYFLYRLVQKLRR